MWKKYTRTCALRHIKSLSSPNSCWLYFLLRSLEQWIWIVDSGQWTDILQHCPWLNIATSIKLMLACLNRISRQRDKSGPITTFYHSPARNTMEEKHGGNTGKSERIEMTDKLLKLLRFNSRVMWGVSTLNKRAVQEWVFNIQDQEKQSLRKI